MEPDEIPLSILYTSYGLGKATAIRLKTDYRENKFSLAGVQMKFSMKEKDGRYNLSKNGELAFAIKRFEREGNSRIHMEDFAQVLIKYPHDKYDSASYKQIGKVIYDYSGDGLADIHQFCRRLLVNILLANSDANLKNWSLL